MSLMNSLLAGMTGHKDLAMLADPRKAVTVYTSKTKGNPKHGLGSPHKYNAQAMMTAAYDNPRADETAKKALLAFSTKFNSVDLLGEAIPVCRTAIPYDKAQLKIRYAIAPGADSADVDAALRRLWKENGCEIKVGEAPAGPQVRTVKALFPIEDE